MISIISDAPIKPKFFKDSASTVNLNLNPNLNPTLTIDARLINSSGIGVYLQNILKSDRLKNYNLKILCKEDEVIFFKDIAAYAEIVAYNAPLYSIKELLQTPAKTLNTDIFWSPHFNVPLFNFAKKLKVVTIHDVFHLAHYNTLTTGQKIYEIGRAHV